MNQLILSIILTILPVSELRGGLPVAVNYALKNNLSIFPIFIMIVSVNILVVFILFFFLDFLHEKLMKWGLYKKTFNFYLTKIRKRIDKFENNYSAYGFLALTLFVAIPFPTTGAWTGVILAWLFGLERKRSILAICLGVLIAGIVVLMASLGIIRLFS